MMSKLIFAFLLVTSSLLGQNPWPVTTHSCFASSSDPNYRCPDPTASSMLGQGGIRNPHCPFLVGVDMPAGKYPTKMPLYFVNPYKKPVCFFDEGEAQIIELNSAFVLFAGKPSSYVVVRCHEGE